MTGRTRARPGPTCWPTLRPIADWLAEVGGDDQLVLGNYVYADGASNVRVATAVDVLSTRVLARRPGTALAFLATPTDVFAVPAEAVRASTAPTSDRSRSAKVLGRPLRTISGGRLLRRAVRGRGRPGHQRQPRAAAGPNYALAKRLQRWRATVARRDGALVSLNVAPPTRTRSVVKNRALAAAYAGAHRFGVEVFEPATSNVLMAALLVHDLHTGGGPRHEQPWQDEAYAAVHGGLWRTAVRAPQHPRDGGPVRLGCGADADRSARRSSDHGVFGFRPWRPGIVEFPLVAGPVRTAAAGCGAAW